MRYLLGVLGLLLSAASFGALEEKIDLSYGRGGAQLNSGELTKLVGADPGVNFKEVNVVDLAGGEKIHRYRQYYMDVPVYGVSLAVKESSSGRIMSIYGSIISAISIDISSVDTKFDENSIRKHATKGLGLSESIKVKSNKWIYQDEKEVARVIYIISWFDETKAPTRPFMIFDANTTEMLDKWEGLTTKDATGPGGNTKTGKYFFGKDLGYLEVDDSCSMTTSVVDTIDMNNLRNGGKIHKFLCPENTHKEINGAFSPLNDGHYFARQLFNMYSEWYGKSPLTHKLTMRIHYDKNYENAFWNGEAMTFGDGGSNLYPLVNIDVTGHEVSHGFTEQNSDLAYKGQSGGINEAFSDIAGEALEFYIKGKPDYICGDDISKNGEGRRFFEDPTKDGRSIGHAKDFKAGMDVHYSSGVFNRAYYNMAIANGYDARKAFDIFVLANLVYWNQTSDFANAACGVYKAAKDKKYDLAPVYSAFKLVGIKACNEEAPSDPPPPIPDPEPTPELKTLENMVPMGWFMGPQNTNLLFKFNVPADSKKFKIRSGNDSSGKGDVAMYVKYGAAPKDGDYDCSSDKAGLDEECEFLSPKAGDYYIWLNSKSAFEKLMIQGIYLK